MLAVEEKWPEQLREGNKYLCSLAPAQRAQKPWQLTPRSTWLAAGPTGHLVAKVISRGISVSVRAKSLKPQVCVFIISSFSHGLQSLAEAPGIQ